MLADGDEGHEQVIAGVALLAAFTGQALRKSRPLVEVRLLARRSVGSSSAVLFFAGFSLYGAMLLMPLYYQDVRGATALAAGVMLIPQGIGSLFSRLVTGSAVAVLLSLWLPGVQRTPDAGLGSAPAQRTDSVRA